MGGEMYAIMSEGMRALFLIGVPLIIALTLAGTLAAAFQTMAAVQEPALTYTVKLAALIVTLYFLLPGFIRTIVMIAENALQV